MEIFPSIQIESLLMRWQALQASAANLAAYKESRWKLNSIGLEWESGSQCLPQHFIFQQEEHPEKGMGKSLQNIFKKKDHIFLTRQI